MKNSDTEVTILPTHKPRKILTVKRRSENLKEHREGFELVNNPNGFLPEPDPHNWVERRILEMTNRPSHDVEVLRKQIWTLFMDVRHAMGKKVMNRQFIYDRVAAAIGYETWDNVIKKVEDGWIKNYRYGKEESEVVVAVRNQGLFRLKGFKFEITLNFKSAVRKLKQVSTDITGNYFRSQLVDMARQLGCEYNAKDERSNAKYKLVDKDDHYLLYARVWEREKATSVVVKKILPDPTTGLLDKVVDTQVIDDPMHDLFKDNVFGRVHRSREN